MEALFPLIITFGLMWVLLIRPQQRRVRQHQAVVSSLVVGDEVVTTGGLIGTVEAINEDVLTVEVAPGVSVHVLRSAVQSRIGPDEGGPVELEPDEIEELGPADDTLDVAAPPPADDLPPVDAPEPDTPQPRPQASDGT